MQRGCCASQSPGSTAHDPRQMLMPSRTPDRPTSGPVRHAARRAAVGAAATAALLASSLVPASAGNLQSQIAAQQNAAGSLQTQIADDNAEIGRTAGGLAAARARLNTLQIQLNARVIELRQVQSELLAARTRLVQLENKLRISSAALASNLRASYENGSPNLMTVILNANGFSDLLTQVNFAQRVGRQDASIVSATRIARAEVYREAVRLGALEERDRALTDQILTQRNQVAALESALTTREIAEVQARSGARSRLSAVNSRLDSLRSKLAAIEAAAAAQARQSAAQVNASVGGIAIDTGGMVQPPAGAPAAVRQMIAAGNAIATLPYIWGGGHGSFQAAGYDCSGSVSYVLAAAGLLSSPEVSGDFESYGDPGPGRWVTIYANADHVWMEIAGWRFDTVALAYGGTRWARGGGEFSGFVVRHPPGL
jgi:peptidoglycan hydrolase CwlO-like protein